MQAQDKIRKRVCKACDRCRLKKSKCDGASPCSRCNADNAICIFGERKKSQDKIYPKGYVEMLEQQQGQLVAGLRDLYNRLRKGQSWPGLPLRKASDGHPLTHDILERLDLLNGTSENGSNYEGFKEDCNSMQRKLLERGAPLPWRQGSTSSKAEHGATSTPSSYSGTPTVERFLITDQFARNNTPPTPLMNSFFPRPSQVTPPRKQRSPMVATTFTNTGAFDSRVLSRAWMNDSMVVENPKDLTKPQSGFESFNTDFDQVMRDDPIYITQTTQMLNWNSTADLDFNKCTQDLSGA